jgi:hypothetical protein
MPVIIPHPRGLLVAGLNWVTLAGAQAGDKEVIARAKEASQAAFAAIRRQYMQVGFASDLTGITKAFPPRYYSFAALCIQGGTQAGLAPNWVGAFEFGNDYAAMVVVRDGLIATDGDIGGTVEDVQTQLRALIAKGGWNRVFAPDSWGLENSVEIDFDEFCVDAYSPQARVRATRPSPAKNILAVLGVLLITAGAYGYTAYADMQKKSKLLLSRLAAEAAEKIEVEKKRALEKEAAFVPHPSTTLPPPKELISACVETMREFPVSVAGWSRTTLKCEAQGVEAEYARSSGSGTASVFVSLAPSASMSVDGQTAKLAKKLPAGALTESRALPVEVSGVLVMSALQRAVAAGWITGFAPLSEVKTPATAPAGAAKKVEEALLGWRTFTFSTVGNISPTALIGLFEHRGVRVTKITVNAGPNSEPPSYLINGELYAENS